MTETKTKSIEKLGLRWGLITFLLLSAYFLIMKLAGLVHIIELRFLNAFIMFFGVYKAIDIFKKRNEKFRYFTGLAVGTYTAIVSSALFTIFGLLYVLVLDPSFMTELKQKEPLGLFMNKFLAVFQIFIEGSISGFVFSFIIMQWYKEPRVVAEE